MADGQQVHVPKAEEVAQGTYRSVEQPAAESAGSGLVNLNTATAEELESLPGVGPATAKKIIASRESEGPFASPEDITRVSGIGDKKYEAIKDLVCV